MSSPDKLTIETPEQTSLEFPLAGIGSRFLALAADTAIQVVLGFGLLILLGIVVPAAGAFRRGTVQWAWAILLILLFVVQFGYFAFFEAIWNGQTPGKRYARLRVMKDDGRPISVYEAISRNLLRLVDQLPVLYAVGIISALISKQNKRLGDYVAGTVVVHERPLEQLRLASRPAAQTPAPAYDVARVSLEEFQLLETFLHRRDSLEPAVRRQVAGQIADRLGNKLGVPLASRPNSEAFLEALAEHRRSLGRFAI
jgi:uncharacterized RDD family membrane protein YckC